MLNEEQTNEEEDANQFVPLNKNNNSNSNSNYANLNANNITQQQRLQQQQQLLLTNQLVQSNRKSTRQVPGGGGSAGELSLPGQQAAAAAAAYALAQENRKLADKLNAEMCRNFSIGLRHENGGVFTSPNYPNPYPANLICTKLIEGKQFRFFLHTFQIAACTYLQTIESHLYL